MFSGVLASQLTMADNTMSTVPAEIVLLSAALERTKGLCPTDQTP